MPARWSRACGVAVLVVAAGCATYSDRNRHARDAATRGDLRGAERELNKLLGVRASKDLPTEWKKDTALALLERGMVLRARRQYKLSARDLSAAEKQLELLDIARDGAGQLGKYVFSDSATKYKAPPSEKLVLNAFNLVNYLVRGDLSGARVEAKRFTTMHDYIAGYDATHPHGAFGSYLAGFVFERLGEVEQALRYYDEALAAREFPSLIAPVQRLAPRTAYRSPRIDAILAAAPQAAPAEGAAEQGPAEGAAAVAEVAAPEQPAEVLVVASVGRVPYKEAARMPIGAAIGYAHAYITGDASVLARSALKVVVYPELVPAQTLFQTAEVRLDGQPVGLDLASDLQGEVIQEYEDIKPKIIGAAISRLIVRAAAAEAARAAGRASSQKNGALIGLLAALAVEGALVAADRPDTRSWTLLPGVVFVTRLSVPPGPHTVTVAARGPGGVEIHESNVNLKSGGFSVVDVTTLR